MKKLLIIGFVGLLSIAACGNEGSVQAGVPRGYTEVSKDDIGGDEVRVIKHIETGCYYNIVNGHQAVAIDQMFVKENGITVPYCE